MTSNPRGESELVVPSLLDPLTREHAVPAAAIHVAGRSGVRIRTRAGLETVDPDAYEATRRRETLIRAAALPKHRPELPGLYTVPDGPLERLQALGHRAADEDGDPDSLGTGFGYSAVFGTWTRIWSWFEGEFDEQIARGAFAKTLAENGDAVRILFNHGYDLVRSLPLGRDTLQEEDATGLYHEWTFDPISQNEDLVTSIDRGSIAGQSFMFDVIRDTWEYEEDELPRRTIEEVRLYEHGPVTWPAYEATTLGVRSAAQLLDYQSRLQDPTAPTPPSGTSDPDPETPAAGHLSEDKKRRADGTLRELERAALTKET